MKTIRIQAGTYAVTGHTKAGELVQYDVERNGSGWVVTLVYGQGADLHHLYASKALAVQAIKNQG